MIQTDIWIYLIGCFISFSMLVICYNKFLRYTENNKTDFFMVMFIVTVLSWIVPIIMITDYIISEIKNKKLK